MPRETPNEARLIGALETTWPPARVWEDGPFLHRDGAGGGQRVSASTLRNTAPQANVQAVMSEANVPLFRVADSDAETACHLAGLGYQAHDATVLRVVRATDIAVQPKVAETFFGWPSLAQHRRIWAKGGIGPARIAVMERAPAPKTALLARLGDAPVGAGFVGLSGDVAMLHALEVLPQARRNGVARRMTQAAAWWAIQNGAHWLALAVTAANTAANALYQSLGLTIVGGYHYRLRGEGL